MSLLLLFCFLLSGAGGLIYEVVWTKLLTLVIGSTVYSISTVLVAFMGGLALGSYIGGRIIDKRGNPLLVYGILEGLIGLYCLIIPTLIDFTDPLFAVFYNRFYTGQFYFFSLLRFIVCAAILIFPTTLMGATLPVLSRYFVSNRERFGSSVGRLYAINTFGAVIGSFGSGFVLLPRLGQWKTILIAAGANLSICALVLAYWFIIGCRREEALSAGAIHESPLLTQSPEKSVSATLVWVVLLAYAANGFAGMVYQIAWTRALSLSLGSSTYSFSLILTAFILGLASGSAVFARVVDRLKNPEIVFGWVEFAIGFLALGVIWGLGNLPAWIVPVVVKYRDSYSLLLFVQFLLVFVLIMAPTFLMGSAFPLAVKLISMGKSGIGRPVGLAYGWNTGGAIAGSFIGGFALIPLMGIQNTIGSANIVNWIAGAALLAAGWGFVERKWAPVRFFIIAGLLATGIISNVIMPPWNKSLMDSGPFLYASYIQSRNRSQPVNKYSDSIGAQVFYDEGVTTTVSVRQSEGGGLFLRVNGKTDASTAGDMSTQVLSGHLPLIFQQNPKDVLVVGLASGVTAGSVSKYSSVERLDIVEISEGVVEACGEFFSKYNSGVLKDPRVNLIIGDGRNHLRETNRKYDAIISEPSNPWIAGISSLFTREYFQSGRDHLRPGGAMFVWFHGYGMDPESFKAIVRTFSGVFPETYLWEMGVSTGSDFGLLGFVGQGAHLDCSSLRKRLSEPVVRSDLEKVGAGSLPRLLSGLMLGPEECAGFARRGRIHTDDLLFLEYEAPRSIYRSTEGENLKPLLLAGADQLADFGNNCMDMQERVETMRLYRARREFLQGIIDLGGRTEDNRERMIKRFEAAYQLDPASSRVGQRLRDELIQRAGDSQVAGNYPAAISDFKRLVGWFPEDGELYFLLSVALSKADPVNNHGPARDAMFRAESLGYRNARLHYSLATIDYQAAIQLLTDNQNRLVLLDEAVLEYRRAIDLKPDYVEAWNGYGLSLMGAGRYQESEAAFGEAIRLKPGNLDAYLNLAALFMEGYHDREKALGYLEKAAQLTDSPEQRAKIEKMKLMIIGKEGR